MDVAFVSFPSETVRRFATYIARESLTLMLVFCSLCLCFLCSIWLSIAYIHIRLGWHLLCALVEYLLYNIGYECCLCTHCVYFLVTARCLLYVSDHIFFFSFSFSFAHLFRPTIEVVYLVVQSLLRRDNIRLLLVLAKVWHFFKCFFFLYIIPVLRFGCCFCFTINFVCIENKDMLLLK